MTTTPQINRQPLSLVSIGSLADFGYTVVPEASDDLSGFNANSPPATAASVLTRGVRLIDGVILLSFTVGRDGTIRATHSGRNVDSPSVKK